ncbi:MAG TPA: SDR family oxidoreductase [Hyphomicrobiaceae bacterium]|nr:SDR family oxidoreductase [Hyphomicrobiaceae bacterium]
MSDPIFSVDGEVILVAGGAGGLGLPIAGALAKRGAKILIADIDSMRAAKAAQDLADAHKADVRGCALDVTNAQSCAAAVNMAVSVWGRLDGLVNATGVYRVAAALDLDDESWDATIDINLTGAFRLARAAGRVMVGQRGGRIVTLASVSSAVANPRYAAYAASKAGVAHLTRVLAVEWASAGVTVNAIGPAATPTPLAQPIFDDQKQREAALAQIPMGRFGTPDDLVGATIFLLSPAGGFVTGQILFVDGGRTIV